MYSFQRGNFLSHLRNCAAFEKDIISESSCPNTSSWLFHLYFHLIESFSKAVTVHIFFSYEKKAVTRTGEIITTFGSLLKMTWAKDSDFTCYLINHMVLSSWSFWNDLKRCLFYDARASENLSSRLAQEWPFLTTMILQSGMVQHLHKQWQYVLTLSHSLATWLDSDLPSLFWQ